MARRFGDSSFSWQDMWFAGDNDERVRVGGVFLNGIHRGDAITVGGHSSPKSSKSRIGVRSSAPRALRMIGLPRIFLPPRI